MRAVIWLAYWLALFLIADLVGIKGWFFEITNERIAYLVIIPVMGGIFYEQLSNYISKKISSNVWKNGYIKSIYSSVLWSILWGFAFLLEWGTEFMFGIQRYIQSLGSVIPTGDWMPTGIFIPIGGLVFPWVHHFISKNKTKSINTALLQFSCLIIGIFLWICCACFLNYVLPCGDSCKPTDFHDFLFAFAVMYVFFFPLLVVPTLLLLLLITLLISLSSNNPSHRSGQLTKR